MARSANSFSNQDDASNLLDALGALAEGVAIFDDADALVICNQFFCKAYKPLSEMMEPGLSWQIFLSEANRRGYGAGLEKLNTHLLAGFETPLTIDVERPGDHWARVTLHPMTHGGFVICETDITQTRRAEAQRIKADDFMRKFLDASSALIIVARMSDGKVLYQSPAGQMLLGVIDTAKDAYRSEADFSDFLTALLPTGKIDDFEIMFRNADGAPFPARMSAQIIEHDGEDVVVASGHDVTQLYAQRDEIFRMREITMQNEKLTALGELLAGVAHELNNPLSVVVGHAMMLQEEIDDPDICERLTKIGSSAERCAKIVKTFLAMARHKPSNAASVTINSIIETALDVVQNTGSDIDIDFRVSLDESDAHIRVDEDQMVQVLINLLTNARQAIANLDGDRIVIASTKVDRARNEVICEVADNGPGVPEGMRSRIFEPFFTTKPVGEGTGLGLALSYRMINAYGGHMSVGASKLGGALFTVRLPLATPQENKCDSPINEARLEGVSALVIEDELEVGETIAAILRRLGVSATLTGSGKNALEILASGARFDVIVSDLKMPEMSGRQTAKEIERRWPELRQRIGFITGDAMGDDALAIVESGSALLEKPISPEELFDFVNSIVSK